MDTGRHQVRRLWFNSADRPSPQWRQYHDQAWPPWRQSSWLCHFFHSLKDRDGEQGESCETETLTTAPHCTPASSWLSYPKTKKWPSKPINRHWPQTEQTSSGTTKMPALAQGRWIQHGSFGILQLSTAHLHVVWTSHPQKGSGKYRRKRSKKKSAHVDDTEKSKTGEK